MEEKYYLAMLHKIGINHNKLHNIFKENSNYKLFYDNLGFEVLHSIGYSEKQIEYILKSKQENEINKLKDIIDNREVKIITIKDNNYPYLLKQISNIPYLLYLRGKIDNSTKISVVGSRKITSYGEKAIEKIVGDISRYFTIVSGGAAGCDSKAHEIALKNGNKTISVIGTGIDIDYPIYNKKLYENIIKNDGGVISIFPVGEAGNPYNFPIRNEIVAGLSIGVLVIEAKIKSGTLITSNLALDMGKDLFAVPGDFNKESSEGCNMIIKKGMAKLTTCSQDILEEYNLDTSEIKKTKKSIYIEDIIEKDIYNLLILESLTIDQLSIKLCLEISTISLKLSMLEINNLVKKTYGGRYELI